MAKTGVKPRKKARLTQEELEEGIEVVERHWTLKTTLISGFVLLFLVAVAIITVKLNSSDSKIALLYQSNRHVSYSEMQEEFEEHEEKVDGELKDIQLTLLRIEILNIYNTYRETEEIPAEMMESYCEIYDEYVAKGGNHYIKDVIDPEIRSWEVI